MHDYKQGKDLVTGDVVHCSGEARTVTHFREHPGHKGLTARVLCSGDFGITTFDEDHFRRTSDGAFIATHLWFDYERRLNNKR